MNRTPRIYGSLPTEIGKYVINIDEMMFYQYLPISVPEHYGYHLEDRLKKYSCLVDTVRDDVGLHDWGSSYVYLTAKTVFTNSHNPGNRPGWHSDGFGTRDLNYVWYDKNPTIFFHDGDLHSFTDDHNISLDEMENLAEGAMRHYVTFPCYTLLRLDESVIHKVNLDIPDGVRSFVKISVSDKPYSLIGNSVADQRVGHALPSIQRTIERNCPILGAQVVKNP